MNDVSARARRELALSALQKAIEPFVDLLLELGVATADAESVVRDAFVYCAANASKTSLRPRQSISLIALKCGLYRGEVARRLRRLGSASGHTARVRPDQHRLTRLLDGWTKDPDFLSREGVPRLLPIKGEFSFGSLVARYAANLYPAVVLGELERVGAVKRERSSFVRLLQPEYCVEALDLGRLASLGDQARDVLKTLVMAVRDPTSRQIVLAAEGMAVDPKYAALLRSTIRSRGRTFTRLLQEEFDDASREARQCGGLRLGVYVIGFGDEPVTEAMTPEREGSQSVTRYNGVSRGKR
jgi:hypothetical protein